MSKIYYIYLEISLSPKSIIFFNISKGVEEKYQGGENGWSEGNVKIAVKVGRERL